MACFKRCAWAASLLIVVMAVVLSFSWFYLDRPRAHTVYQVSTGNALIAGLFEGAVDFKTLAKEGDFGLGSVKGMDGELIAIDGKFYRISPDGSMNIIPSSQTTPYAIVTHFSPELTFELRDVVSLKDFVAKINRHLPNRNQPYAIHIKGKYDALTLRAVRGANPPYPEFIDLVKNQAIFNLEDVVGDGVGFFYPAYLAKVNTPGYHIHFITTDRAAGGHILNMRGQHFVVSLMAIDHLKVALPQTKAFKESKALNKDNTRVMVDAFGPGIQLQ